MCVVSKTKKFYLRGYVNKHYNIDNHYYFKSYLGGSSQHLSRLNFILPGYRASSIYLTIGRPGVKTTMRHQGQNVFTHVAGQYKYGVMKNVSIRPYLRLSPLTRDLKFTTVRTS